MSIAEFIQNKILRPRLQKTGCLVVYDPAGHYQDVCNGLADERLLVVDASMSSIESRVAAIRGLRDVDIVIWFVVGLDLHRRYSAAIR